MTWPPRRAIAVSITSGLCSVTCARTAVRVGWTCFEISPRTESVVATSSMSNSDPTSAPYVPPSSIPTGPPMIPTSRPIDAAARGADVAVVPDLALDVDATVGVARDDGGAGDLDLALRVELLEVGERLVGVRVVLRVVAEGDDQHVVR